MSDFYSKVAELGMANANTSPSEKFPNFDNENVVLNALYDAYRNNRKTLFYGDYDPDGAYCKELLKETAKVAGFTNFEEFHYIAKTHDVDLSAVTKALSEGFEYMIICDAGSADPRTMYRLQSSGVKVILIDHHQSVYGYEDFEGISMVNSTFDNRLRDKEIKLSAAAITYVLCVKLLEKMGRTEPSSLAPIALASLYADVIDMSDPLCRTIYFKAISVPKHQLPIIVTKGMNERSVFRRRFIEYRLNPMMNGLFRANRYDLLNRLLAWKPGDTHISIPALLGQIDETNSKYRAAVETASDILEYKELGHFVLGNLNSVVGQVDISNDLLPNYTGLVANKLCEKYKKTAVVFADTGVEVKASLRDMYGRNYLDLFRRFCNANGHNSAFGIHIKYLEFEGWLDYMELVDRKYPIKSVGNEPIIVSHNFEIPDKNLLMQMAMYNEFSGNKIPKAYLTKIWLSNQRSYAATQYSDYTYNWGEFKIKSKYPLKIGSEVLLQPTMGATTKSHGTELRAVQMLR